MNNSIVCVSGDDLALYLLIHPHKAGETFTVVLPCLLPVTILFSTMLKCFDQLPQTCEVELIQNHEVSVACSPYNQLLHFKTES